MPAELPDRNFECGRARRAKKSLRVRGPVGLGTAKWRTILVSPSACVPAHSASSSAVKEGGVQTKYLNGVVLLIALI